MAVATSSKTRVLVVDDHPAIREALASTINTQMDMMVVGEAASADQALRSIQKAAPQVVIVDLSLEDVHGLDLVHNIRAFNSDVRVIVFSMYDERVYAERAIRSGASGYLMKSEPTRNIVEAIRSIMKDEVYLSQKMFSRILGKVAFKQSKTPGFAIDELTDREMAVFQMLGEGFDIDEISDRLSLSRKTVETYRRRAKEKLGLESIGELLQYAVQWIHGQSGA